MNGMLHAHLQRYVLLFFNDILCIVSLGSSTFNIFEVSLEILQKNCLFTNASKCKLGCQQGDYIGHVISKNGNAVDSKKVEAITSWSLLNTTKVEAFWDLQGIIGRLRRGMRIYLHHWMLNVILKMGSFHYDEKSKHSFEQLKQSLMSPLVIRMPNFERILW